MKDKFIDRIESERQFWNSKAKDYDKVVKRVFPKVYEIIFENLVQDTSQSKKLLEAATGTGILAIKLSNYLPNITAIDLSPEMLNVAKEKTARDQIKNIDFRIGDVCNLEFTNESFDTVVASNVLHLLVHPEMALREMHRVLSNDGRIIIPTFCHGANLKSKVLSRLLALFGQKTRSRWNQKSFIEFIELNGFKVTKNIYVTGMIPLIYLVARKR